MGGLEIILNVLFLLGSHLGDDQQLVGGVACHDAGGSGGLQAVHAVGVGDDDALYIFNNVAADADLHPLRPSGQLRRRQGRRIGNRNRLGAAHGRHQLLL